MSREDIEEENINKKISLRTFKVIIIGKFLCCFSVKAYTVYNIKKTGVCASGMSQQAVNVYTYKV